MNINDTCFALAHVRCVVVKNATSGRRMMTTKRTRWMLATAAIFTMTATAGLAHAGWARTSPISIYVDEDGIKHVSGNVAATRRTTDGWTSIDCEVRGALDSDSASAYCYAYPAPTPEDATPAAVYCFAPNRSFVEAAATLTGDSTVRFALNPDGTCRDLVISNGSSDLR